MPRRKKMSSKSWDVRPGWKLTALVKDATLDTVKKHGGVETRNPFVTLRVTGIKNRQQRKTQTLKHTVAPRWKELFFFELPRHIRRGECCNGDDSDEDDGADGDGDDSREKRAEPTLEIVVSDSGVVAHHIGTATVKIRKLQEDTLTMLTRKLRKEVKDKKKERGAPDDGRKVRKTMVVGEIHVMLHLTRMAWVPPPRPFGVLPDKRFMYLYDKSMEQFHPGDVVLYSTAGPAAALLRVEQELQWSHCGIVVEMPNRWTQEPELCVLEFCSNREEFVDAYREQPIHNGPMVFRLAERIHGFHGTEAWLMRLRKPLSRPQVEDLTLWTMQLICDHNKSVTGKGKDDRTDRLPFAPFLFNNTQRSYFEMLAVNPNVQSVYCEYYSPEMVSLALHAVAVEVPKKGKMTTFMELTTSKLFFRPFLIRCRQQFAETPEWPYEVKKGHGHHSPAHKADEALKKEKSQRQQVPQQTPTDAAARPKPPVPSRKSRRLSVLMTPERPDTPVPKKPLPSPKPVEDPKPVKDTPAETADPNEKNDLLKTAMIYTNSIMVRTSSPEDKSNEPPTAPVTADAKEQPDDKAKESTGGDDAASDDEVKEEDLDDYDSDSEDDFFSVDGGGKEGGSEGGKVSEPDNTGSGKSFVADDDGAEDDKGSEGDKDMREEEGLTDYSDSSDEGRHRVTGFGPCSSSDLSDSEAASESNPGTPLSGSYLDDDDDYGDDYDDYDDDDEDDRELKP